MSTIESIKSFFGFEEEVLEGQTKSKAIEPPVIKPHKPSALTVTNKQGAFSAEIRVEEPHIYEDSLNIATHLRESKPIIVNLKHLDQESGKRLIDFICGTAYAINGHMMKIADHIFLFTPAHVAIGHSNQEKVIQETSDNDSLINNL